MVCWNGMGTLGTIIKQYYNQFQNLFVGCMIKPCKMGLHKMHQETQTPARSAPAAWLHQLHVMSNHRDDKSSSSHTDDNEESEENLQYPGKEASYEEWEEFYEQQMGRANMEIQNVDKLVRKLKKQCDTLTHKQKRTTESAAIVAQNATRQALQLVCQPVPFNEREYTRMSQYTCKELSLPKMK